MRYFVCKTCGRGLATAEKEPKYCYADRMDHIEGLSEEDSRKMFLFRGDTPDLEHRGYAFEFPGDVKFDPFTGIQVEGASGYTLSNYQDQVMERVRAN